jgi:hypothetical protein
MQPKILFASLVWSVPASTPELGDEPVGILIAKAGPNDLAVFLDGRWVRFNADSWAMSFRSEFPQMVPFKKGDVEALAGWALVDTVTKADGSNLPLSHWSEAGLDRALGRFAHRDLWPWFKVLERRADSLLSGSSNQQVQKVLSPLGCKPTVRVVAKVPQRPERRRHAFA